MAMNLDLAESILEAFLVTSDIFEAVTKTLHSSP